MSKVGPIAVVLGGTGAIGRELVGHLLESGKWKTVITIGRREVEVPAGYSAKPEVTLLQRTLDMDKMAEQAADVFQGADTVFCALGTTRKVAGSAEQFKKVDYEWVKASAELAKKGGVKHYSLVTAVGSNPNVWSSDLAIFQGLLYMKTKGLAEEAVKAQGFPNVSIFRPGMLDRGELLRGNEKFFMKFMSNIKVSDVGKLLVLDAERTMAGNPAKPGAAAGVPVFEMADLMKAAKACTAPECTK